MNVRHSIILILMLSRTRQLLGEKNFTFFSENLREYIINEPKREFLHANSCEKPHYSFFQIRYSLIANLNIYSRRADGVLHSRLKHMSVAP